MPLRVSPCATMWTDAAPVSTALMRLHRAGAAVFTAAETVGEPKNSPC